MIRKTAYVAALFAAFLIALGFSSEQEIPVAEKNGLKLFEVKNSSGFPDAQISLKDPSLAQTLTTGKLYC